MKNLYAVTFGIVIHLHAANNFIAITPEYAHSTGLQHSLNQIDTELINAIKANDPIENITDIINRGANVNVKGVRNMTPLHEAAHNGNFEIAKLLLEHGAHSTVKNSVEATPVDIAEINGHNTTAQLIDNWQDLLEIKEPDLEP